jgi:hypothetical protein
MNRRRLQIFGRFGVRGKLTAAPTLRPPSAATTMSDCHAPLSLARFALLASLIPIGAGLAACEDQTAAAAPQ